MIDRGPGSEIPAAAYESGPKRHFLTFRVDGQTYALPGEEVAEIILVPPVAVLPHSPKSLMGLVNLRGTVLPMVDLRALLDRGAFVPAGTARAIVCSGVGAVPVVVVVDMVADFLAVDETQIETRRAELATDHSEKLRGAFWPDAGSGVTKILDLPSMFAAAFGNRSAPTRLRRAAPDPVTPREAGETAANRRLLVSFAVAGQDYALALETVREIVPFPETIIAVPRSEAVLLGVTAYRGRLLPLLSLRALLGFAAAETFDGGAKVIVIPVGDTLVGLVADGMRAIIRAEAGEIETAPPMLAARAGGEARIAAIWHGDGGRHLVSVLAPEQLFREDVMRRLGEPSTEAAPASGAAAKPQGELLWFVVFQLDDELFALPISAVDEVASLPDQITSVPKTPEFLEGVINLRGEVLPVVDQRRRFGLPRFDGAQVRRLMVVRAERHRAGLIVDGVSGVLSCPADAIKPAPDLGQDRGPSEARLITGVINEQAAGRMILLLDPSELLTGAERAVLDAMELDARPAGPTGQTAS